MTADVARLPYDLLGRVATRIVGEVAGMQPRAVRYHHEAAGEPRVGITLKAQQIKALQGF